MDISVASVLDLLANLALCGSAYNTVGRLNHLLGKDQNPVHRQLRTLVVVADWLAGLNEGADLTQIATDPHDMRNPRLERISIRNMRPTVGHSANDVGLDRSYFGLVASNSLVAKVYTLATEGAVGAAEIVEVKETKPWQHRANKRCAFSADSGDNHDLTGVSFAYKQGTRDVCSAGFEATRPTFAQVTHDQSPLVV